MPLGLNAPLWVDAEDFDPAEHIHRSAAEDLLRGLADAVLSEPLRARPAAVGVLDRRRARRRPHRARRQGAPLHGRRASRRSSSARCCSTPSRARGAARRRPSWLPGPARRIALELLARGAWDRTREQLGAAAPPARARRARRSRCPGSALRTARALAGAVLPVAPPSALNEPGSPERHLATARRPLDELRAIKNAHGVDRQRRAARRRRGRAAPPRRARARSARATSRRWCRSTSAPTTAASSATASRSCSSSCRRRCADPLVRLRLIGEATSARKESGVPEDADGALQGARLRAAHGAAGGRARARQPARLQPRRLEHPRPADADVHARLPAARGLSGRAAVGRATRCRSG